MREALERLVSSSGFVRSRRLTDLLRYTVEATLQGRSAEIKESTIGMEVYQRGPDFDPRIDGIVRVEVNRLRQKLEEYYAGAGQSDPIRIEFNKGSYIPRFVPVDEVVVHEVLVSEAVEEKPPRPASRQLPWVAAAIAVVGMLAGLGWWWSRGPGGPVTAVRSGLAIIAPLNLSGRGSDEWLGVALREMISAEVANGGLVRIPPGESVVGAQRDLGLKAAAGLSQDTLRALRQRLNIETLISGSYLVLDPEYAGQGQRVRVDLKIQRTTTAETVATISETGTGEAFFDLAVRLGAQVRRHAGLPDTAAAKDTAWRVPAPTTAEAARLYYTGIDRFRKYDPLGAADALQAALRQEPDNPMTYAALAQCWQALGHDAEARNAVKRAYELRATLPRDEQLAIEAQYHIYQSDPARAASVRRALVTFYPDNLDHRLKLADALIVAGRMQEASTELRIMKALPSPLNEDPRIDFTEVKLAHLQSDFPRRLEAARRMAAKARRIRADWLLAEARVREAGSLVRMGKLEQAAASRLEARAICQRLEDLTCVAYTFRSEGGALYGQGDLDGALEAFHRVLALARQTGSLVETINALNGMATVIQKRGDRAGAQKAFLEALALARQRGAPFDIKLLSLSLAELHLQQGELGPAGAMFSEALQLARQAEDSEGIILSLCGLGDIFLARGEAQAALKQFAEAREFARRSRDSINLAETSRRLGLALLAAGKLDEAAAALAESRRAADASRSLLVLAETHLAGARLAQEQKRYPAAEAEARAALTIFEKSGDADGIVSARRMLTEAYLGRNRLGAAAEIAQSIESGGSARSPSTRLEARITVSRFWSLQNRQREARQELAAVIGEASRLGMAAIERHARVASRQMDRSGVTEKD